MVTSVSSSTSSSVSPTYDRVEVANKVLASLLESPEVAETLVSLSSKYVPPSSTRILSTLWGLINTRESKSITKEDLRAAVFAVGKGSTNGINALWEQLDPEGKGIVSAGDFASSEYLGDRIVASSETILASVEETRISSAPATSGTLFDFIL